MSATLKYNQTFGVIIMFLWSVIIFGGFFIGMFFTSFTGKIDGIIIFGLATLVSLVFLLINFSTRIILTDECLVKSNIFFSYKIFYKDIKTINVTSTYMRGAYFSYLNVYDVFGKKIILLLSRLSKEDIIILFSSLVKNVSFVSNNEDFIEISKGDVSRERFDKISLSKEFNEKSSWWNVVKLLLLILTAMFVLFYIMTL